MKNNRKGFVFIETIVVISVLTIALMSLYANYAKIMSNTKELNTFDTVEYNYKTYYIKEMIRLKYLSLSKGACYLIRTVFSDKPDFNTKVCYFTNLLNEKPSEYYTDAYINDYLNNKTFNQYNDDIILVEYKKKDLSYQEDNLYITYISSITY